MALSEFRSQGILWSVQPETSVEIHFFYTDRSPNYREYFNFCSPEEVSKAKLHRFDHLKRAQITTYYVCRLLLSEVLQTEPQDIVIQKSAFGKPYLSDSNITFNLSHAANVSMVGITRDKAIGVDIQEIPQQFDFGLVARDLLTTDEFASWENLPLNLQSRDFIQKWVKKEAEAKMRGLKVSDWHGDLGSAAVLVDSKISQYCSACCIQK